MLFGNEIPFEMLLDSFPKIANTYLREVHRMDMEESLFSLSKTSFQFEGSGNVYYVMVYYFPFKEMNTCVDLVKRTVVVISEGLEDIYVFSEILRKSDDGRFYYEIFHVARKGNKLHYEPIMHRAASTEQDAAMLCSVWAHNLVNSSAVSR